jgi:hypothetical protein
MPHSLRSRAERARRTVLIVANGKSKTDQISKEG